MGQGLGHSAWRHHLPLSHRPAQDLWGLGWPWAPTGPTEARLGLASHPHRPKAARPCRPRRPCESQQPGRPIPGSSRPITMAHSPVQSGLPACRQELGHRGEGRGMRGPGKKRKTWPCKHSPPHRCGLEAALAGLESQWSVRERLHIQSSYIVI